MITKIVRDTKHHDNTIDRLHYRGVTLAVEASNIIYTDMKGAGDIHQEKKTRMVVPIPNDFLYMYPTDDTNKALRMQTYNAKINEAFIFPDKPSIESSVNRSLKKVSTGNKMQGTKRIYIRKGLMQPKRQIHESQLKLNQLITLKCETEILD